MVPVVICKKTHNMMQMKKTIIVLALLAVSGLTSAQTTAPSPGGTRPERMKDLTPDERAAREAEKMTEKLGLNAEQKQRWQEAATERLAVNKPLKDKLESSTTPAERKQLKAQMRQNGEAFDKKVGGFLNEDQKKKYADHRQQQGRRHNGKGPQHQKENMKKNR
jgi:periplasmic protein CpxP/Spy